MVSADSWENSYFHGKNIVYSIVIRNEYYYL